MSEPVFFPGGSAIAVIADSHRYTNMLETAAKTFQALDGIILLGDHATDIEILQETFKKPIYAVRGNCDFPRVAPEEMYGKLFSADGPRFYACHGHRYNVKMNPFSLLYRAKEVEAQAAFYGHTHIPALDREEGVLLLNPGALRDGRYAIVYLEKGRLCAVHRHF